MSKHSLNFNRYLPIDQQAKQWGWMLLDAGCHTIPKNGSYPADSHPENYLFDTERRRTLDEFQLVYITEGEGSFESRSHLETKVHAGQALLLFTGEWHRYRPDPAQAWTEYWLGFHGREAERIMATFFDPRRPILTAHSSQHLHDHFKHVLRWLEAPSESGNEQILASYIPLALALLHDGSASHTIDGDRHLIEQAKTAMLDDLSTQTDLQALAKTSGSAIPIFVSPSNARPVTPLANTKTSFASTAPATSSAKRKASAQPPTPSVTAPPTTSPAPSSNTSTAPHKSGSNKTLPEAAVHQTCLNDDRSDFQNNSKIRMQLFRF